MYVVIKIHIQNPNDFICQQKEPGCIQCSEEINTFAYLIRQYLICIFTDFRKLACNQIGKFHVILLVKCLVFHLNCIISVL